MFRAIGVAALIVLCAAIMFSVISILGLRMLSDLRIINLPIVVSFSALTSVVGIGVGYLVLSFVRDRSSSVLYKKLLAMKAQEDRKKRNDLIYAEIEAVANGPSGANPDRDWIVPSKEPERKFDPVLTEAG